MIIEKEKHVGFATNVSLTKKFEIVQNDHMFEILSNKIYNDKISSWIREASSNALDSQEESGTNERFKIWLPTRNNHTFKIRDYGTGLSRQDVLDVYTCFGKSTRQNSKDSRGYYGLGSKVCLSISKLVNVSSFQNGKQFSFVFDTTEGGIPQVHEMTPPEGIDTNEPNGLMISFVCPNNCSDWYSKAKNVYKVYPENKLPIDGNINKVFEVDKYTWLYSKNDLYKYNNSNITTSSIGVILIMGDVAYPVDTSQINTNIESLFGYKSSLWIYADLGAVTPNTGRESLQYTKKTIDYIDQRLQLIHKDICSKIEKELSTCKTDLDFIVSINKLTTLPTFTKNLKTGNKKTVNDILKNIQIILEKDNSFLLLLKSHSSKIYNYTVERSTSRKYLIDESIHIIKNLTHNDSIKIFLKDSTAYLDKVNSYVDSNKRGIIIFTDAKVCKEFCDALGCNFELISKLPDPPKVLKNSSVKLSKVFLFKRDKSAFQSSNSNSRYWSEHSIDFDKDCGFYAEINNYQFRDRFGNFRCANDLANKIVIYEKLYNKTFDSEIYGIKTAIIKKVINSKNKWVNIDDYLSKEISNIINKTGIINEFLTYQKFETYVSKYSWRRKPEGAEIYNINSQNKFDNNHIISIFCKAFDNDIAIAKKYWSQYNKIHNILNLCFNMPEYDNIRNNFKTESEKIIDKVYDKYPNVFDSNEKDMQIGIINALDRVEFLEQKCRKLNIIV